MSDTAFIHISYGLWSRSFVYMWITPAKVLQQTDGQTF